MGAPSVAQPPVEQPDEHPYAENDGEEIQPAVGVQIRSIGWGKVIEHRRMIPPGGIIGNGLRCRSRASHHLRHLVVVLGPDSLCCRV